MNYEKIYTSLIAKYGDKVDGYSELHHIKPLCTGGSDDKSNLVYLPARVHYLAHWILWKWLKEPKLGFAFAMMTRVNLSERNYSRKYDSARKAFSSSMSLNNPMHNPEVAAKISGDNHYMQQQKWKDYFSAARQGAGNPMWGKENNTLAKRVKTPKGVFRTVSEACDSHNLNRSTVRRYLNDNRKPDWFYMDTE